MPSFGRRAWRLAAFLGAMALGLDPARAEEGAASTAPGPEPIVLAPLFIPAPQGLGLEVGFLSVPVAKSDPYSFAAAGGLWYEHVLGRNSPWTLGGWLNAGGFRSLDQDYGPSLMYSGGLELGYALSLFRGDESAVSLRPCVRLGWYARKLEILGASEWGSRPLVSAGCGLDLKFRKLQLGFAALASVPIDNDPPLLAGFHQRVGLCF
jgi:hypothetical protein